MDFKLFIRKAHPQDFRENRLNERKDFLKLCEVLLNHLEIDAVLRCPVSREHAKVRADKGRRIGLQLTDRQAGYTCRTIFSRRECSFAEVVK